MTTTTREPAAPRPAGNTTRPRAPDGQCRPARPSTASQRRPWPPTTSHPGHPPRTAARPARLTQRRAANATAHGHRPTPAAPATRSSPDDHHHSRTHCGPTKPPDSLATRPDPRRPTGNPDPRARQRQANDATTHGDPQEHRYHSSRAPTKLRRPRRRPRVRPMTAIVPAQVLPDRPPRAPGSHNGEPVIRLPTASRKDTATVLATGQPQAAATDQEPAPMTTAIRDRFLPDHAGHPRTKGRRPRRRPGARTMTTIRTRLLPDQPPRPHNGERVRLPVAVHTSRTSDQGPAR
jgi:hypothetical protein